MTSIKHPADATLSVTKAARFLSVHPNTVRAWSDQGRLSFLRINERGDRRYRLGDLQRFLAEAEKKREPVRLRRAAGWNPGAPVAPSIGAAAVEQRTRPSGRVAADPASAVRADPASAIRADRASAVRAIVAHDGYRTPPRTRPDVAILARLSDLVVADVDADVVMRTAVDDLHDRAGHGLVAILEHRDGRLVARTARGAGADRLGSFSDSHGLTARALRAEGPVAEVAQAGPDWLAGSASLLRSRVAAPIRDEDDRAWGVLLVADEGSAIPPERAALVSAVARWLGIAIHAERLRGVSAARLHRADALRRISIDLGTTLDVGEILASVVEHARTLFGAERAAASLIGADGCVSREASRGLSPGYLDAVRDLSLPSLTAQAAAETRPIFSEHYRDDPRAQPIRAAVVQEGFDTVCAAPLRANGDLLGLVTVYHDRPHAWDPEELGAMAALAAHVSAAVMSAQRFARMETWAAQLQSIQQLGARLARLTTAREIGNAISNELETLIAFHNVRVYRLREDGWLVPVAMRGLVGEFKDETPDLLRIRIGEGITGWVARNNLPQNLGDAASDPRTQTIAGTDDDLEESMLLAPMVYEDEVLGVIVLSKLGLRQFSDDDLRLLVIYASLAAQAIANADTSEHLLAQSARLERRLASQRALLATTESILGMLETRQILEQVVDRLSAVVRLDTISIELLDRDSGILRPVLARGVHAAEYLQPWEPGEEGLATWVVAHGEPQLVRDELVDPRIRQFQSTGPVEGSLISVPLRGLEGSLGVISMERLGSEERFDEDDFELVQLFGGQVSIALRNAAAFRVKEIEAQTDQVTGLLNAGTFRSWLEQPPVPGERCGLLMLDLDHFKDVNETMGHEAGTELLRRIARAISESGRDSDRVFRYGGDEFAVVVPTHDPAAAMAVARRIRHVLQDLARGPGGLERGPRVSASIGVATYPEDGATHAEILLAADRACFVAKRRGRDLIATAAEGLALAADFTLSEPTPMDPVAPPLG